MPDPSASTTIRRNGAGAEASPRESAPVLIKTDEQWDAVCSGPRVELIMALASLGPSSIAEMSVCVDRPADSLYHHVRRLVRAGLFVKSGTRKVGRHSEAIYELASEQVKFDIDPKTGHNSGRILQLAKAHWKRIERELSKALEARTTSFDDADRNAHVRGDQAWLTREEVEEVNEHMSAIREVFSRSRTTRRGDLHAYTFIMTPVVRSRSADARPTQRHAELVRAATEEHGANGRKEDE